MHKRTVLISCAIIFVAAGPAHANVIIRGPSIPSVALLILASEALLTTLMLKNLGFIKPLRIFLAWLAITSISFVLFFKFLKSMEDVSFLLKAVTGELWVIILEALALYCVCLNSFFYQGRSDPLKPAHALGVSAIVNIASMMIGFALTGLRILH